MSPMSLALGWGLAFSTFVTLLLVPALYVTASDINRRVDAWRGARAGHGDRERSEPTMEIAEEAA